LCGLTESPPSLLFPRSRFALFSQLFLQRRTDGGGGGGDAFSAADFPPSVALCNNCLHYLPERTLLQPIRATDGESAAIKLRKSRGATAACSPPRRGV